jgi:hypothetical protein
MAAVDDDGEDGQQEQQATTACKIGWRTTKGMDKSKWQEMAETRSGDDSCGGGSWPRWMLMAADNNDGVADNDSSGRQRRRTTTARKIGQQTTRGKEENGWQTTMALDRRLISQPGSEHEKVKKSSLRKKTFFSNMVCPVGFFAPAKTANVPFLLYQSYMVSILCCGDE